MTTFPTPVSNEAVAAFRIGMPDIVAETVRRSLDTTPVAQHGEKAPELLKAGLEFTTNGLHVAMLYGTVDLLAEQMNWAMERLPHDGVATEHVLARLEILRDVVAELLPADHARDALAYVDWMIAEQRRLMGQVGE